MQRISNERKLCLGLAYFQRGLATFRFFSAQCDLPSREKFFDNFFEILFEDYFPFFLKFLSFSVKEISFLSLECDLFVTFEDVELMSFLIDSGEYLASVFFGSERPSNSFIWSKGIPLLS